MKTGGRKRSLIIAGLGLVAFMPLLAFAGPDTDNSLSAINGAYKKALNTLITNAAASVADCSGGYVAALKALQVKLQKEGDLIRRGPANDIAPAFDVRAEARAVPAGCEITAFMPWRMLGIETRPLELKSEIIADNVFAARE